MPVLALVLLDREGGPRTSTPAFVIRTVTIVLLVGAAIAVVLLPFWIALIQYPVTQTPIPHPSRANYILSPKFGLNYFLAPYGAMILALPFIVMRGSSVVRLRPLLLGFWVAFLIGLGGTTPVGHLLLGRAFEVLTMERFTYWATLLALPIVGLLVSELVDRFRMRAVIPIAIAAAFTCAFAVAWVDDSSSRRGEHQGEFGGGLAQSRSSRPVPLHHAGIWRQDLTTGSADRCRQRGRRVELRPQVAGVDQ